MVRPRVRARVLPCMRAVGGPVAGRRHTDLGDVGGRLAGGPDPASPGRARRTASVRFRQECRRGARLRQRRSRVGSEGVQDRRTGRLGGICGPRAGCRGLQEKLVQETAAGDGRFARLDVLRDLGWPGHCPACGSCSACPQPRYASGKPAISATVSSHSSDRARPASWASPGWRRSNRADDILATGLTF